MALIRKFCFCFFEILKQIVDDRCMYNIVGASFCRVECISWDVPPILAVLNRDDSTPDFKYPPMSINPY